MLPIFSGQNGNPGRGRPWLPLQAVERPEVVVLVLKS